MKTKQISVFIENQSGRLYEVMRLLGDSGINIRALSLADTSDFGIIRLIVNNPDRAYKALKDKDFTVGINEVVAIAIPDKPGGLADVLETLCRQDFNVEYMYAFVNSPDSNAVMIFRFDDSDAALKVLRDAGITVLKEETLLNM